MTQGKVGMPIDLEAVAEFLHNIIDRIIVLAGIFLLIIAILQFSPAYQWFTVASFLFGVFLIVFGVALHFESFTLKVPSKEGWGTILMCVSVLCMSTAIMVALFAVAGGAYILPTSFRRGAESIVVIQLVRPILWLAPILLWGGVGLLLIGLALKFF